MADYDRHKNGQGESLPSYVDPDYQVIGEGLTYRSVTEKITDIVLKTSRS